MQVKVRSFLEHCKIVDSLPDNCPIVVMNHELTLAQVIEAQICQQNATFSLIYHTGQREFTGIVTLRNILELICSLMESLDQFCVENQTNIQEIADSEQREKKFIEYFLQAHMVVEADVHAKEDSNSFMDS